MLPHHVACLLARPANSAIATALTNGASVQSGPPGTEVGFVAALVLAGVPGIAAAWQPILKVHGYRVSLTGVFCHATPQVRFPHCANTYRCELADLLLVIDDVTSGKVRSRRAVLVQAKMIKGAGPTVTLANRELPQLHLYSSWPQFSFVSSAFVPPDRDFGTSPLPGAVVDCGRYGLIDGNATPRSWQQSLASRTMSGNIDLGTFMAEMADNTASGSGRQATAGGSDAWSKTVDDLLKITAGLPLVHTSLLPLPTGTGPIRGVTAAALLADRHPQASAGYLAAGAPPDGGGRDDGRGGREGDGISTIRIMLSME